jgi:hypothetical protein
MGFSRKEREYQNTQFQPNLKFLTRTIYECAVQHTIFKL